MVLGLQFIITVTAALMPNLTINKYVGVDLLMFYQPIFFHLIQVNLMQSLYNGSFVIASKKLYSNSIFQAIIFLLLYFFNLTTITAPLVAPSKRYQLLLHKLWSPILIYTNVNKVKKKSACKRQNF